MRHYDKTSDRGWAEARLDGGFGGAGQARKGELVDVLDLDGFVAERAGDPVGLLTWRPDGDTTELAFMWAFERRRGIGSALMRMSLDEVEARSG
jgi:ribosomal protein S18 acetylase RimI-like enzyme